MKRIVSIILAAIILIMPVSICAEGATVSFFEMLAKYPLAEREEYIALLRPFLTTQAGVAAGIDNVKTGMFEAMLGVTFDEKQEDAAVRTFKSFDCIDEETGIRLKYADIFQKKIPAKISALTAAGIKAMTQTLYAESKAAQTVLTEGGYTDEVIANFLKIVPEINGTALFEYKTGTFFVGNVNSQFAAKFDAVWQGYTSKEGKTVTAYKIAEGMANFLNQVPENSRLFTARALENLGVCTVAGEGTVPPVATKKQSSDYTVVTHISGVASSVFTESVVVESKTTGLVEFFVDSENPMIYRLKGASILNPVKLSVPTENGIKAMVESGGVYVIKTCAYPFVDAQGWGKDYIAALYARGIINGKSDCEFMPDSPITREEFVKLVVELFDLTDENARTEFTDVMEGAWYYKYVASAERCGIIGGIGDGKFGTGAHISRQDMAKIINTILTSKEVRLPANGVARFKDDTKIADYAKTHVYAIAGYIISGDDLGNFNPTKSATRQEAAKMIYGMLSVYVTNN